MTFLRIVGLYLRTIRHLTLAQFVSRAKRAIFKIKPLNIDCVKGAVVHSVEVKMAFPSKSESILGNNTFIFLNRKIKLKFPDDWHESNIPLLWLYNLHYFDGLLNNDTPSQLKLDLIKRWIQDNSKSTGVPWDPYPLSLRLCNWIKWIWSHDGSLPPLVVASLFQQATHLNKTLEFHLLGNHLLENAKALIFSGYYFGGITGDKWLKRGLLILNKELAEQILEDGGHFELSPMYHSLVLELVLDVLQLAKEQSAPKVLSLEVQSLSHTAAIMSDWLRVMSHPDNEIAFFNDAAIGIAPSPNELLMRANNLSIVSREMLTDKLKYLRSSGYIRLSNESATALIDVAEVGASYLPGHGHADTLSIEFSLFNQRMIVNTGSSEYGLGERRDYERSTSAHSTLEINDLNSSEVWAGFRVGRRAHVSEVFIDGHNCVTAKHNGYRFLPGSPTHKRSYSLLKNQLLITDHIDGPFNRAKIYFHIHPSIKVSLVKDGKYGFFVLPDGSKISWESTAESLKLQENLYSMEFGKRLPMRTIVLELKSSNEAVFSIKWN
jgi:uncharacterized heparinase superfamily protein